MLSGRHEPGFEPLARSLENILRDPPHGGAALAVYDRGKLVFDMWGGPRNADGEPWEEHTPSVSYSTSKGVAAAALHICKDRGLVRYDDPVAKYWPSFAQNGKQAITVRQALSHSAGLFDVRNLVDQAETLLDWDATIRALELAPAAHAPGRYHAYHALTYGYLIGEIVRRVAEKPFARFVREEIAEPLGLADFFIGAPDDAIARAARNIHKAPGRASDESAEASRQRRRARAARFKLIARGLNLFGIPMSPERMHRAFTVRGIERLDFSSAEVLRACIPAANGLFSARDLARFYATLANGGSLDGVRLLSPDTVREATTVQSSAPDGILLVPMRWRLGYHAVFSKLGIVRGAYGHSGYNGSGAWASPQHEAALGYVVNAGLGTPVGDWRMVKLTTTALACIKARRKRVA
jgi:CubicO group peptidase (beta-lactamase class C family)